jgi:hypothetical protein
VRLRIDGYAQCHRVRQWHDYHYDQSRGGFRIDIPQSNPLQLSVGPVSAGFYGFLDSNGNFLFSAYAGIHVTAGPAYLDVNGSPTIGNSYFNFTSMAVPV